MARASSELAVAIIPEGRIFVSGTSCPRMYIFMIGTSYPCTCFSALPIFGSSTLVFRVDPTQFRSSTVCHDRSTIIVTCGLLCILNKSNKFNIVLLYSAVVSEKSAVALGIQFQNSNTSFLEK